MTNPKRLLMRLAWLVLATFCSAGANADPAELLVRYCIDFHDTDDPKGELSLFDLDGLKPADWQKVFGQIANGEIPPKKREPLVSLLTSDAFLYRK